jgi:hypothetical protein
LKVLEKSLLNLDGEHDDLVSIINQKLNALDNLQNLSNQMASKLEASKKK